MKISTESMATSSLRLLNTAIISGVVAEGVASPIDQSFSSVSGIDAVGGIFKRTLTSDVGSAKNSLREFGQQVEWLGDTLRSEFKAFFNQESSNSHALDIADAGGAVGHENMPIVNQPQPGYSHFSFVPPSVSVGPSLPALVNNLSFTKHASLKSTREEWNKLGEHVGNIVQSLDETADALSHQNEAEAISRAISKIQEVAGSGRQFMANADKMALKATVFQESLIDATLDGMMYQFKVNAIPDPAAKKLAEQAALQTLQAKLQALALAAVPDQHPLMEPKAATGGGSIDAGLGDVAGDGTRYSTESVVWPKAITEAMANGTVGPGSFEVADGQIQAVAGVDPEAVQQLRETAHREGTRALREMGFGDVLPMDAGSLATQQAATPSMASAGTGFGTATPMGAGASGVGAGPAGAAAVSGGAVPGGQTGMGGFAPVGAAVGGSGSNRLAAGIRGGSFGAAPGGVAARLNPGGAGAGYGGAGAGAGNGAASPRAIGGPGAGASSGAAGAAGQSGGQAARGGGAMRGMVPMMAGPRGNDKKETLVKMVTTKVERDPNRRDLLGEAPAVVPGVIGDWVRDQKPD